MPVARPIDGIVIGEIEHMLTFHPFGRHNHLDVPGEPALVQRGRMSLLSRVKVQVKRCKWRRSTCMEFCTELKYDPGLRENAALRTIPRKRPSPEERHWTQACREPNWEAGMIDLNGFRAFSSVASSSELPGNTQQ